MGPETMTCDHPDKDVSYGDTGDFQESKIARCSACGHEWYLSQKEWRELTSFDEGYLPEVRRVKDDIIF